LSTLAVAPARLLLRRKEAAEMMAMSLDTFERYVQPEIKLVRRGSMRLVPVSELERWKERNASLLV
jgi:excisionase family DNA binding protein